MHICVNSGGCRNRKGGRCVGVWEWYMKSVKITPPPTWVMAGSQTEIRLPTSAPLVSARALRTPHAQPRHLAGPPQLRSLSARRRPSSGAEPSPALPAASPLPAGRQARADSRPSLPPQPRRLCQARRGWGTRVVPAPREPAVPRLPSGPRARPSSRRPARPARSAAPRAPARLSA